MLNSDVHTGKQQKTTTIFLPVVWKYMKNIEKPVDVSKPLKIRLIVMNSLFRRTALLPLRYGTAYAEVRWFSFEVRNSYLGVRMGSHLGVSTSSAALFRRPEA